MSTYFQETKHPETGKWERATWHDDHFGKHLYGVQFPSDGKIFDPRDVELETREHTEDGKSIETKTHPDGRKDVTIGVQMLDVKEDTEAGKKAKEHIEDVVIPALADQDVLVVILHKPTNQHAERIVKAPHVRAFAQATVTAFNEALSKKHGIAGMESPSDEFVVIEHNIKNNTVTVSTL